MRWTSWRTVKRIFSIRLRISQLNVIAIASLRSKPFMRCMRQRWNVMYFASSVGLTFNVGGCREGHGRPGVPGEFWQLILKSSR